MSTRKKSSIASLNNYFYCKYCIEFSFESFREVTGLSSTTLHDWLKKLISLFNESELKPKLIVSRSHMLSRSSRHFRVIFILVRAHCIVWVFVIGQSHHFGFSFTIFVTVLRLCYKTALLPLELLQIGGVL